MAALAFAIPSYANADFINDSHLDMQLRSFSLNRNFLKNDSAINKQTSYSAGALITFKSGYTDTPLAVGFDLDTQNAVRLSSTGNDGSLPFDKDTNKTLPHYGRGGGTLKLKYANTVLKVGNMQPANPVLATEDTRMLPSVAQGAVIESRDINGLMLTAGQYWSQVTRQSTNREKFYLSGQSEDQGSGELSFAGLEYAFSPVTSFSQYYGVLRDIYRQSYTSISHGFWLKDDLKLNISGRYNRFWNDGDARGGYIDNQSYGLMTGLNKASHSLAFSYQQMLGNTGYPQLSGDTPLPYLVNWGSLGFNNRDERSWSLRYRYEFSKGVLDGLGAGVRYSRGTNIYRGEGVATAKESETDFVLTYHPKTGSLKNFGATLLYVPVRQSAGVDVNTLRLQLTYNINIF